MVKLPQVPEVMRYGDGPNDREKIETEIIKALTASYFDVVRKNFMDMVPKTIMYFLVNHAQDNLQNELVSNLYREDLIGESHARDGGRGAAAQERARDEAPLPEGDGHRQ